MPRYAVTVQGESLPDLIGALTAMASLLHAGDAGEALTAELAPLAEAGNGAPLPLPPPDYQAAGLTDWQMRQAAAAPQPAAVAVAPAAATSSTPVCQIHAREMVWKGGALSKNGKALPLWSCPDTSCREAIWPPR